MEAVMPKYPIAIAGFIAATLMGAGPSQAYEGPWCAIVFNGEGAVREICHFRTFAECQAEVVAGNRGTCGNNPRYAGRQSQEGQIAHVKKRKRHRH
jgi:hypothetical protein